MNDSPPIFLLILLLAGVFGAAAIFFGRRNRANSLSRPMKALAALPALVFLGLFCSLGIHMHASLGAWPNSLGNEGFSAGLDTHATVTGSFFGILLAICLLAWPVVALASLLVERFRPALPYLGVFAVSCAACFALMSLAPSEYLYWWWD